MAVCNIFNNLTENTNSFLLFSQYTDDLNKMTTSPALYRVVPSKFIVLKLENLSDLPNILMKDYENGVAYIKQNQTDYDVNISKNLFWNTLFSKKILNTTATENTPSTISEIKYCGSIDIQSFEQQNGMGYSEIYCWIPNDAKETSYEVSYLGDSQQVVFTDKWLCGFTEQDQANTTIDLSVSGEIIYLPDRQWIMAFEDDLDNQGVTSNTVDSNMFDFNSIIVLYNIEYLNSDGTIGTLYSDIPMGIWICNQADSIKKFVSNEDIYNQGTSYGLRILSRFTPTPNNDTIKNVDINLESGEDLAGYSRVMSGFADINSQISALLKDMYNYYQTPKELLAIFKNSRVNVPYIKYIDNIPYWFVNGRCLNIKATGDESSILPASETDIMNTINKLL